MKNFLQKRDFWGNGYPLWVLFAVAFLLPPVFWSLGRIRMQNDVASWLPRDDPQSVILNWYQDLFPNEERILLSWDDCSLTDERIPRLAAILQGIEKNGIREGGSPYISEVRQPTDVLKRMMREGIPFRTALERIDGLLVGKGPLCIRFTSAGRLRGDYMKSEVLRIAREMNLNPTVVSGGLPMPESSGIPKDDEAGWKLHDELTEYVRTQPIHDLRLTWERLHIDADVTEQFRQAILKLEAPDVAQETGSRKCIDEVFFITGSMAAVSVALTPAALEDHRNVVEVIRKAAEACGISESSLHLGGRAVASAALNQAVKNAAWNSEAPKWNLLQRSPILLSLAVTFLTSVFLLRSARLTILVQCVSVLCAVTTVALVPATGGSMNMVLIVMPTLLMVITTSAAIHLCNYWRNSGIHDPVEAVQKSASEAWLPCFLASATTAIGLASLIVSSLVPVRDFGIYASIGCGISFLCALYVLPSLMLYWPRRPPKPETVDTSFWRLLGKGLTGQRHLVNVTCLAATLLCAWGLVRFRTETKVVRYFPDESRLVRDYHFLEGNLSGIVSVDTIVRFDTAAQNEMSFSERARRVLQIQESLKLHPEVSGALSLASFLDLTETDTADMTRMQRMKVKRRENEIADRIREKLDAGGKEAAGLSSMLAIAEKSADLDSAGDQKLNRAGDELWRITCQSSVMSDYDYAVLTRELHEIAQKHLAEIGSPGTGHIVTGLIPIFLRTQQALLESLISSFGLAFLVIWLVMGIQLRSLLASAFAMLPNIMPVVMMFGILGWSDIRIDIGTMITASVALGIAVDGTLHMMTWFTSLIRQGHSRRDASIRCLEHCGPALWQSSAAIGFGMLALFPVELLLISRFGWIMTGMIAFALIGDAILLPALLSGVLGRILERGITKRQPPGSSGISDEQNPAENVSPHHLQNSDSAPDSVAAAVSTDQTLVGQPWTILPAAG
ncbi:MAG: efflux RND transporter permease subunit [Planctomyces sp.]